MAKKTPLGIAQTDPPGPEPRPEVEESVKALLQRFEATAEATSKLPLLTKDQAFELEKLRLADRRASRNLLAGVACFFVAAFVGLCWLSLAYNRPELLTDLLKVAAGGAGGLVGGYGLHAAGSRSKGKGGRGVVGGK
jgi:hypothetical protein